MNGDPQPLLLEPAYVSYLWGGSRLREELGRKRAPARCAESWEVSDRDEGMSTVADGPLAGTTLRELVERWGAGLVGSAAPDSGRFPLLVKLIDARLRLSVQVHPDDASAVACGGEAKTECWHVLDSAKGSSIFAGLRPGVDEAEFRAALDEKRVGELLNVIPAGRGTTIFVPGGLVHAIGEGCLILEVQQNSNTTYRVYDWDRVGADGKPRELHVEKAMSVIGWKLPQPAPVPSPPAGEGNSTVRLVSCPHFTLEAVSLADRMPAGQRGTTFAAYFVSSGRVGIRARDCEDLVAERGATFLLPAALDDCTLVPFGGPARLLRAALPG
ncbi:MAG: mannose-6-phosphate isomerase [Lentisphaerae bacterium]|nr:mannose-6-phosphate isomerase [Lentisphaerota bacterium]